MRVKSKNPWAQTLEIQRSDLWTVDFSMAVSELAFSTQFGVPNRQLSAIGLIKNHQFFAASVQFPDAVITPENTRRDSRQYNMPGWDAPMTPVRMVFFHNVSNSVRDGIRRSEIYQLLDLWRIRVRAGRGGMSTEPEVLLDQNFRAPKFRFDITVKMASGYPLTDAAGNPLFIAGINNDPGLDVDNGGLGVSQEVDDTDGASLEVSSVYSLKNAWLGSISLAEANHEGPGTIHKINTMFYVDDIKQL
jgi:hypothetical protein